MDLKSNVHQINLTLVKPFITRTYTFEGFRLDAEHMMLYRGEDELSLPPKQVETLLALVEHHGEIVHKDVLMTRLWGNTAVEESNLIQNVYVLRKILGKTANGKPMIETLRRRGYRFNGEFEEGVRPKPADIDTDLDGSTPMAIATDTAVGKTPYPRYSKQSILALCIVVLLVTGGFLAYFLYTPQVAAKNKEFAVLPVHPIEPGTRSDLYEIGIADALIQGLSSINGFVVRPLSETRKYIEIGQDPLAAGRQQKVDYVVMSSYQIADGRIKVTSQLLNVATAQIEETYQSEDDLKSVFAAQESVAGSIRSKLMARFGRTSDHAPVMSGTTNEEAYKYYLQGMVFNDRRIAVSAIENLEKAVSLDANFARAWAGVAHAHLTAAGTERNMDAVDEYRKALAAINKALALDPHLSEAHSALCVYKFFDEYQFAAAETECKLAVELDPKSGIAHANYGTLLSSRGRHPEAFREVSIALDLEPTSYFYQRNFANSLYFARRYDEAVKQNQQILEINDSDLSRYNFSGWALEMQGKDQEAFEWFIKSLAVRKSGEETIERYKAVYQASGWTGVLRERAQDPAEFQSNYFRRALINVTLGNKDLAFEDLEKAYDERFWKMAFLQVEPKLDPLRDDPRFQELVRRVEVH